MDSLIDWLQSVLSAPAGWSVADRIAAAAFLLSVVLSVVVGLWTVATRRADHTRARLASAPDVAVTFARKADAALGDRVGPASEHLIVTLENIGPSPAYEVDCALAATWDPGSSPAHLVANTVTIPHMSSRERVVLTGTRAPSLHWEQEHRQWDDFPFALIECAISFSDRTHRYTNTYVVSLFGFPDQISEEAENEMTIRISSLRSVSLEAGRTTARLHTVWESIARPFRRRRYQRLLKRQNDGSHRRSS